MMINIYQHPPRFTVELSRLPMGCRYREGAAKCRNNQHGNEGSSMQGKGMGGTSRCVNH